MTAILASTSRAARQVRGAAVGSALGQGSFTGTFGGFGTYAQAGYCGWQQTS